MNKKNNYSWLMQHSKSARSYLTYNIILGITAGFCLIAQAALLAIIIDHVYLHHATRAMLTAFLGLFLALIILRAGLSYYREKVSFKTAALIKTKVRQTLFAEWMQRSPAQLAEHKTGELSTTLLEKIEALHGFYADYLPQMMITVFLPIIILCFVFPQNWMAGCILLFTAPLIPLFMALIGMGAAKLNQENFQQLSRLSTHFLDILQGLTTLTLFNRAKAQTKSIETLSNDFREKTMRILRVAFLSSATLELFATISIAIIAVYLGLGLLGLVHVGFGGVRITLTQALFILLLAPEFYMPLRQLGVFYHARAEAIAAASEIINASPEATHPLPTEHHEHPTEKKIKLSLRQLHFSYPHKTVFQHYSLDIPFGDCIAITGPSGVGKSTLLHLIAKFLLPTRGDIFANQVNINTINDDDWRTQVTLLHQHPRLHYGSIADNIRFAKQDATDEAILNAAKKAGVTQFTDHLPKGLNTIIHENNIGLSGGQIQRVALARLILRDASIVLLDEPTNYLDEANIAILWDLIEGWRGKKTVVIATHDEKMMRKMASSQMQCITL